MSRLTRKTVAAVCAEHPDYAPLIRAVVRATGVDSLEDIYRHGASWGAPGLTYYRDTRRLSWAHRADLRRMVEDQAEDWGRDPGAWLQDLRGLEEFSPVELVRSLYTSRLGDSDVDLLLWNALAWYGAERVAAWFWE